MNSLTPKDFKEAVKFTPFGGYRYLKQQETFLEDQVIMMNSFIRMATIETGNKCEDLKAFNEARETFVNLLNSCREQIQVCMKDVIVA